MRILFILPAYTIGGTMSSLVNLLEGLNHDSKYDLSFFAISPDGPYRDVLSKYGHIVGDNKYEHKKKTFSFSKIVRRVKRGLDKLGIDITPIVFKKTARSLEKSGYDIVIGFQENYPTQLISYFRNTYKIAWIHCDYKNYLKRSNKKAEILWYNKIDRVICVSNYTLAQFMDCIQHKNARCLYNVILENQIKDKSKATIDSELFPDNKFCIVSVGRIHPVKQFCRIPEIIDKIKNKGISNFVWYLIGGGSEVELKRIIENRNKYRAEELVILGERENPYPYLSKADLYVCTSESEACPYVINESKILGTPVLSTQFGSVHEFITDAKDGFIGTIDEFPSIIENLISHKEELVAVKSELSTFVYPNAAILNSLRDEILTTDKLCKTTTLDAK